MADASEKAAARKRGEVGEDAALRDYASQGYTLKCRNWRTRQGEVDIIMCSPDGTLVFAEVKTRSENSLLLPKESVDKRKQQKLILAAQGYLSEQGLCDVYTRFDVVEVTVCSDGTLRLNRIEGAFTL